MLFSFHSWRRSIGRRIGETRGAKGPHPLRTFVAFSAVRRPLRRNAGEGQGERKGAPPLQYLALRKLRIRRDHRQRSAKTFRQRRLGRPEKKRGAVGKRIPLEDSGGDEFHPM